MTMTKTDTLIRSAVACSLPCGTCAGALSAGWVRYRR